jgi:hypothetical protein
MRVPKQVNVLGETYKIRLVAGLVTREHAEGYLEPDKFLISLDSKLVENERYFWRVYWHEVGHAFAHESGLHEFMSAQALEMFCQAFSALMVQMKTS